MNDMKVGDELDFKGPTGHIIYEGQGVFNIRGEKKTYKKIGCLAGGTGVTPCFQLMQHTDKNSEPLEISLLYANQTPDDILMKDQLDEFPSRGMKVTWTENKEYTYDAISLLFCILTTGSFLAVSTPIFASKY